jgi:hypothetical protein
VAVARGPSSGCPVIAFCTLAAFIETLREPFV